MDIRCSTKDTLELGQLTEFQGGLKSRTDADYAKIITSIKKYGFSFPFFVWSHDGINHVLDGHGRMGALQLMQSKGEVIQPLPVVYVNCKDEEAAKNLLLRLNSQYGTMTVDSVLDFMGGLEFDPLELALPDGMIDFNLGDDITVEEDDDVPELVTDEPAVSKPGEIYHLGPHRLMCGDSTSAEDVEKLMAGEKADIAFTSPPYNADHMDIPLPKDRCGGSQKATQKKYLADDDHRTEEEYQNFLEANIALLIANCKEVFYNIGVGAGSKKNIAKILNTFVDNFKELIYWKKTNPMPVIAKGVISSAVELIIAFGSNNSRSFAHFDDRMFHGVIEGQSAAATNKYADIHKATFPVYLPAEIISKFTEKGNTVFDCFGGTGTTMIAAQQLGRKCYMMELDPHYCDVIRKRWTKWAKENGVEPGPGALE